MEPWNINNVACLLIARIVKLKETAVARQWLSSRHVMAATNTYATPKEQLPLPVGPSLRVGRKSAGGRSVETCSSGGRGQFGNPEEAERTPLEAATKQRLVKTDWEH
jgi:hypothetical protein